MSEAPQTGTSKAGTSETTSETSTGATGTGAGVPEQTRGQERVTAPSTPPAPQHRGEAPPEPTGWVGWIVFASIMMLMVGCFQVIMGLTAVFNDSYFLVVRNQLLIHASYTAWGWTHFAIGVVAIASAFGLLTGRMWARVLGICVAGLSLLVNLAFTAAYPVWALSIVTLDVILIYAIAVHGAELKRA